MVQKHEGAMIGRGQRGFYLYDVRKIRCTAFSTTAYILFLFAAALPAMLKFQFALSAI